MTMELDGDAKENTPLVRKVAWTALTGFIAFSTSALLDGVLEISLAEQLIISSISGGVALLIQYLADFELRLREFRSHQRKVLADLSQSVQRGFASVSEAAELMQSIEGSALNHDVLKRAIRRAGLFRDDVRPILRSVADSEIQRVSETLQALADGHEVFYEGEDRELLLALTRNVTTSIMATSWATVSAHGLGFEAGFWLNDLGGRYLDLQRMALRRNVLIKRIFVYETPELIESEALSRVLDMQLSAGINVRLLSGGLVRPIGAVADFVLFDEEISYDTTPVTRGETSSAPWLLTTRLVLEKEIVTNRIHRFQELWEAATEP